MEWSFKVRLSKVSAKQLNCAERTPHSLPFFRVDFDGKVIQSELCQSSGDPSWQHKSSFEYRLSEDGVQQAIASLCARTCAIEVLFSDVASGREISVGRCVVDLYTVASGASTMTYELARSGSPSCGSVSFDLSMEQQSVAAISLSTLAINGLPRPAPYKLSYHFLSLEAHEVEGSISSPTPNPQWDGSDLPKLLIRTTLRGLMEDTVRVHVRDVQQNGAKIAHFDLPLREFLSSNAAHSASFTKNAYANPGTPANFTALVTGTIAFRDLPVFAQFVSGANNGGMLHGKPLFPSCPPPPNYSKLPQKLPPSMSSSSSIGAPVAAHQQQNSMIYAHSPAPMAQQQQVQYQQQVQQTQTHTSVTQQRETGAYQQTGAYQVAFSPAFSAPPSPRLPQLPAPAPLPPSNSYMTAAQPYSPLSQQVSYPPPAMHHQQPVLPYAPIPQPYPASPYPPAQPTQSQHVSYTQAASTSFLQEQSQQHHLSGSAADAALNRSRAAGLSTASDQLIRQHHDTVEALAAQQRRVKQLHDELQERTLIETTNVENRMRELMAEEQRVLEDLRRADARAEEIRQHLADQEAQAAHFLSVSESEHTALTIESNDLDDLSQHLQQLLHNITTHVSDDEKIRERARYELDATRSRLDTDIKDLNQVEQKVTLRLVTPSKVSGPASGIYGQFYTTPVSPTRRSEHSGSRAVVSSSSAQAEVGGTGSTSKWEAEDLMAAVQANDANRFLYIMSRSPSAILLCDSALHQACAQAAPDFDIVHAIVAARPELVLGVDTNSGNTALHFACAAKHSSMEVLDVLIRNGANVNATNNDGLTPFHIALLNIHDNEQHRIKRFLVFKGQVNINTQTAKGETPAHICVTSDRYVESLRFLVQHGASYTTPCMVMTHENRPVSMTPVDKARMMGVVADECRRFLERALLGY